MIKGYLGVQLRVGRDTHIGSIKHIYFLADKAEANQNIDWSWILVFGLELNRIFGGEEIFTQDSILSSTVHTPDKVTFMNKVDGKFITTSTTGNTTGQMFYNLFSGNTYTTNLCLQLEDQPLSSWREQGSYNDIKEIDYNNAALIQINLSTNLPDYEFVSPGTDFRFQNVFDTWDSLKQEVTGTLTSTSDWLTTVYKNRRILGISTPADIWIISDYLNIESDSYPSASAPPRDRPTPVLPDPAPEPVTATTEILSEIATDPYVPPTNGIPGTGYFDGPDYPITLPTPTAIGTQTNDLAVVRANEELQATPESTIDGKFVYVFETTQANLRKIMDENTELTIQGKDVIIKKTETDGYLMPLSYLKERWTYEAATLAAIFEMDGDKTIRISDEGKMLVTVKSKYALYSYLMLPTDKADIPEEGPDPDSPAYQYEQANNNT